MQTILDDNPNRIEADVRFKEARREAYTARGAMNLGSYAPFGNYVPTKPRPTTNWFGMVVAFSFCVCGALKLYGVY